MRTNYSHSPQMPACERCGRPNSSQYSNHCASCHFADSDRERDEMFSNIRLQGERNQPAEKAPLYATALLITGSGIIGLTGVYHLLKAAYKLVISFFLK